MGDDNRDDHRDDLSVKLDWPVDPLAVGPVDDHDESDPLTRLEARLAALEERPESDGAGTSREVASAVDDLSARLDYVATELIEALRSMNQMMAMLASRQAEEQRTHRRDWEGLVAKIETDMSVISRRLTEAIAAARTQSDVFADRVAAELQALRRRMPVKGRSSAIDDRAVEEIVTRVADEVEIRVVAAIKPRTARKKS